MKGHKAYHYHSDGSDSLELIRTPKYHLAADAEQSTQTLESNDLWLQIDHIIVASRL